MNEAERNDGDDAADDGSTAMFRLFNGCLIDGCLLQGFGCFLLALVPLLLLR